MGTNFQQKLVHESSFKNVLSYYKYAVLVVCVGLLLSIIAFIFILSRNIELLEKDFHLYAQNRYVELERLLTMYMYDYRRLQAAFLSHGTVTKEMFRTAVLPLIDKGFMAFIHVSMKEDEPFVAETVSRADTSYTREDISLLLNRLQISQKLIPGDRQGNAFAVTGPFEVTFHKKILHLMALVSPINSSDDQANYSIGLIDVRNILFNTLAWKNDSNEMNMYLLSAGAQDEPANVVFRYQEENNLLLKNKEITLEHLKNVALFYYENTVTFFDQKWRILFVPTPSYTKKAVSFFPWLILFSGILFTGAISVLLSSLIRSNIKNKKNLVLLEIQSSKLQRVIEQLRFSNGELEKFAYVASHDLKSPLRAIDNLTKWMQEDLQKKIDDENQERMDKLRGRVERMECFLDDLLEYAKAGRTCKNTEIITLGKMVEDVCALVEIPESFTVEYDEALKNITVPRMPLQQVVGNLVNNALKHHDKAQGRISIEGKYKDKKFYEFKVTDDGPGIPKEFHEKIFEMFQTLKPRDQVEGSGMGLALVKKIIYRCGGKIRVESREGAGTSFIFTWPQQTDLYQDLEETLLEGDHAAGKI